MDEDEKLDVLLELELVLNELSELEDEELNHACSNSVDIRSYVTSFPTVISRLLFRKGVFPRQKLSPDIESLLIGMLDMMAVSLHW